MAKKRMEKPEQNKPIRESTYETLKQAIILGEIPAGSRLIETAYAESMHISRTPLREAFRKLELDGLVEYVARRGVVVSAFTIGDIEEIFTIRNALMMLIVPSIIANITEDDLTKLLIQRKLRQRRGRGLLLQRGQAQQRLRQARQAVAFLRN